MFNKSDAWTISMIQYTVNPLKVRTIFVETYTSKEDATRAYGKAVRDLGLTIKSYTDEMPENIKPYFDYWTHWDYKDGYSGGISHYEW